MYVYYAEQALATPYVDLWPPHLSPQRARKSDRLVLRCALYSQVVFEKAIPKGHEYSFFLMLAERTL